MNTLSKDEMERGCAALDAAHTLAMTGHRNAERRVLQQLQQVRDLVSAAYKTWQADGSPFDGATFDATVVIDHEEEALNSAWKVISNELNRLHMDHGADIDALMLRYHGRG